MLNRITSAKYKKMIFTSLKLIEINCYNTNISFHGIIVASQSFHRQIIGQLQPQMEAVR